MVGHHFAHGSPRIGYQAIKLGKYILNVDWDPIIVQISIPNLFLIIEFHDFESHSAGDHFYELNMT